MSSSNKSSNLKSDARYLRKMECALLVLNTSFLNLQYPVTYEYTAHKNRCRQAQCLSTNSLARSTWGNQISTQPSVLHICLAKHQTFNVSTTHPPICPLPQRLAIISVQYITIDQAVATFDGHNGRGKGASWNFSHIQRYVRARTFIRYDKTNLPKVYEILCPYSYIYHSKIVTACEPCILPKSAHIPRLYYTTSVRL